METRLNFFEKGQDVLKPLFTLGSYIKKSPVEDVLELVYFRISQINGCGYCLDMHSKDARAKGETEQRLYGVSVWKEAPYYTDREKAAFAWAEAVNACHVPDDVYKLARTQFSEQELFDLTVAVCNLNTWNRLNISFANTPGTYSVGQFG